MRRFVLVGSVLVMSACSAAPGPQPVNQPSGQQVPARPAGQPGASPAGSGAPSAGSSEAAASAPTKALDDKVAALETEYAKKPGDASIKKELADATYENANYYMYSAPLPPREKYPKALTLYRKAVALDPSNQGAKDAIAQIEEIYRSLGKAVPAA